MTHQIHPSVSRDVVQTLAEHGFDGMAQAIQLLLNECMKLERQRAIGAAPFERSDARCGQANGFKPRTIKTRIGPIELAVPQVRGAKFYPQVLERGTRRDLKLGICGEHGGDPASVAFCHEAKLDYVSCSPFRVPIARLAAAQAALGTADGRARLEDQ